MGALLSQADCNGWHRSSKNFWLHLKDRELRSGLAICKISLLHLAYDGDLASGRQCGCMNLPLPYLELGPEFLVTWINACISKSANLG